VNDNAIQGDELRELYRELILDHARSPRHFGKLDAPTHTAEGINPLCGDKLKLYVRVNDDDQIEDVSFEGSGCAISVASASLLTDTVAGRSTIEAIEYADAVAAALSGKETKSVFDLGKIRALEGVREFPSRVKCATLAWHAMTSALANDDRAATTE
jgi:nitrogen fixation NifU-like protein